MREDNFERNWVECQIDDIADRIHYGYTATARKNDEGVKYLRITDIQNGKVNWDTVPVCEIDDDEIDKFQLFSNDLVFARTGGTVGKSYLLQDNIPSKAVFASYLIRVNINRNVFPKFIYQFFQSLNYWSQIELGKTGLKTNVNAQILAKLRFNLAPLPEQRTIVAKIEQLFSELGNGITNLKAAKAKLAIYRQAVLKKAFEGELTDSKDRIGIVLFGKEVKIVSGSTPKGLKNVSNSGEFQFYKVSDMNLNGNEVEMQFSNLKLTLDEVIELKIKTFPKGTVIFPKRGGAILTNKKRILSRDASFDLNLMGVVPNERYLSKYLYYFFLQIDLGKICDGSAVPQINNKNIGPLDFPKCGLEDQVKIIYEIETRLSVCDNILRNIEESLAKAEALRQSILKKAFEGKLLNEPELAACRQQPDWEPAEKLLARIQRHRRDAMHGVSTRTTTATTTTKTK